MSILRLTEQLYVSPQIAEADAAEAAKLGIRTVICNRPDGEEPDQPEFNRAAGWFSAAGIRNVQHQPVTAPQITETDARAFARILQNSESPVLAYCRTGTRSSLLWALGQAAQGRSSAEIIAEVKEKTGIDLSSFEAKLQTAKP